MVQRTSSERLWCLYLLMLGVLAACQAAPPPETQVTPQNAAVLSLPVFSDSFRDQGRIPQEFTCEGPDRSPHLRWGEPPPETKSFVVIVDDPDAPGGVFSHWIVFGIPRGARSLNAGQPRSPAIEHGALQGSNDAGQSRYSGPCPPPGPPHEYRFYVYAIDTEISAIPGSRVTDVLAAMRGHVLAVGLLTGTFQRSQSAGRSD